MYPRVKRGSPAATHEYLQIVEGYREGSRVKQRVVANLGRLDGLMLDGSLDGLLKGLGRFSEQLKVIERARLPEVTKCQAELRGPVLVFRRLWEEQELPRILGAPAAKGWKLSWPSLLGDLSALKAVQITLDGRSYTIRTELEGDCYKGFQAVGLRPPGRVQLVDSPEMLCH